MGGWVGGEGGRRVVLCCVVVTVWAKPNMFLLYDVMMTQTLGLSLDKYIPDPSRLKSTEWDGILTNEAALEHNFASYIAAPLLELSEDLPCIAMSPGHSASLQPDWLPQDPAVARLGPYALYYQNWHLVATTGVVVAAAAVAVFVYSKKRAL